MEQSFIQIKNLKKVLKVNQIGKSKQNKPFYGENDIFTQDLLKAYIQIGLISTKNSGKTTLILNLLKNLIPRKTAQITQIFWFSPTHQTDLTIQNALKELQWLNIQFYADYDIENFQNVMLQVEAHNDMIKNIKKRFKKEQQPTPEQKRQFLVDLILKQNQQKFGQEEQQIVQKKNPRKKMTEKEKLEQAKKKLIHFYVKQPYQQYQNILIFDDPPQQCLSLRKYQYIQDLAKKCRHLKCCMFFSSQHHSDFSTQIFSMLDILVLYRSVAQQFLERLFKKMNLQMSFQDFMQIYNNATQKAHNFLCINKLDGKLYKNFEQEYSVISQN